MWLIRLTKDRHSENLIVVKRIINIQIKHDER